MNKRNISLYILKASGRLDIFSEQIEEKFWNTVKKVANKIPISDIDIVICDNPMLAIPELGIGGHTHSPEFVVISLDPKFPNFSDKTIKRELKRTIAHELNHVARWKTVGYGETLLEALISEGLADHFDIEITNESPEPWDRALNANELKTVLEKAKKEYQNKKYNHEEWFFGSKEKGIPKWTGYTIGYSLVSKYLKNNLHKKPSQLYNVKAEEFIK